MVTFRSAIAVSGAAALGLVALVAAPAATASDARTAVAAAANRQPAFLSPGQMPPSSTPWTADPVTRGLPETGVFCSPGTFPEQGTRHRTFRTDLDTGGVQVTTVASTEAKAVALVEALRQALLGCGERIEQQYPGTDASSLFHGKLAVEEGAYVYSLDTANPEIGNTDIHLFSVGRDGRAVTYVQWGQMGDLADAPLTAFKNTTRTAVNKLYP
ncbi:hypothetical protein ACGFYP_18135 [Streptomyces sp. NPDC048370]|uniref:hypothetical protein n=1 Tax=Streptomyces sp. NPDC048370 TaxID=3365540 RepID=UPI0037154116